MSFGSLVFTPLVKKLQERYGSRRQYERMENAGAGHDRLTDFERQFLAERDSFYMATTGATGWPYVQHRGGSKGFLKVIDDHTIAFADLRGNKQYITTGNLQSDDRVALILVDYPRQARLKILGHVEILDRAGLCDPCRGLRLELSATHYAPLHGRRGARRHADDRAARRCSRT